MSNGKNTPRQQTGPGQSGEDRGDVADAVALLLKHLIGSGPGVLGDQISDMMDGLNKALSPLQALQPDYGELPKGQADLLRLVQAANSRADLSRASPGDQKPPKTDDKYLQKGART